MNAAFYSRLLGFASVCGLIAVIAGAFGAHFLKERIDPSQLEVLRTGVLYLFIHTLTILVVVILGRIDSTSRMLKTAGIFFCIGIILFSGSLFVLSTREITGMNSSFIGILTPIGGLCFVAGWLMLLIYSIRYRS
jgi:uncharacterized membrane protein YgdD (TMEM256/DUF423 family)